ncbi:hypothetical protein FB45DRAFT_1022246 [Roridomyces roridus]|uniref:Rad60/SUMO-like domain-containing protein n=1 Tax=Roridomyces roridus TaxID=1738132 RepID=A0AAD7C809_9AGAR|nr:hypothetical protein FB45DRAFT_1022246 [Roridomyces roridus]
MTFDMGQKAPFRQVLPLFCTKVHQEPGSLRFCFDGKQVELTDTPLSLGMDQKETNVIDVTSIDQVPTIVQVPVVLYKVELAYSDWPKGES